MWFVDMSPLLTHIQPSMQDDSRTFPAGLLSCQLLFSQMCGTLLPQAQNFAFLLVEPPEVSQGPSRFTQMAFFVALQPFLALP